MMMIERHKRKVEYLEVSAIVVVLFVFAPVAAFGVSLESRIEGYWNEPGADLTQTHEFLGQLYGGNEGSVFIEINRRKEGSFLWVQGLTLRIDSMSITGDTVVLDVVRTLGFEVVTPRQEGKLLIHLLPEGRIWFEPDFSKTIFEDVFGGAVIELGIGHTYVRTIKKLDSKKKGKD